MSKNLIFLTFILKFEMRAYLYLIRFFLMPLFADLLFIFFSVFLIIFTVMVIVSGHPIFSLIFLVGSFLISSFILLLLECELLALLFLMIYVGAIAVLILFSVMMLDFKSHSVPKNIAFNGTIGVFSGSPSLFYLIEEINKAFKNVPTNNIYIDGYINWFDLIDSKNDVDAIGYVLYSNFVLQFLLAGIILLMVLFGVVSLTNVRGIKLNAQESDKKQDTSKQMSRNSKLQS